MLPFIEDRRVENFSEKSFLTWQLFLQPGDDIAAHHHMDMWERLLDHLAKRESRKQLHLRPDREPDNVRLLFRHRRHDQLIADIPIDVHLLIVQTGELFLGYAG